MLGRVVSSNGRCVFTSAIAAMIAISFGMPALTSPITYYYSGQPLTLFDGTFSCVAGVGECEITGQFTLPAPLGNNLNLDVVTPTSYSFTDGVQTLTNVNSSIISIPPLAFQFSTDPLGNPTNWDIRLISNDNAYLFFILNFSGIIFDAAVNETTSFPFTELGSASNNVEVEPPPGTWSTTPPSAIPEPSSALVVGVALLCVAGARFAQLRRRS